MYVCTFQPGNFTGCGSERVNIAVLLDIVPFVGIAVLLNIALPYSLILTEIVRCKLLGLADVVLV